MQDYRPGNAKTNATIKLATRYKVNDVTLKRGVLGALDLIEWLNRVRNGEDARRPITIQLQSEDRKDIAMTWRLEGAQPMKYTGPSLNGKGTDVAIEELVLSVEDIKYE
jgi:phage tail-like protein